ncbi:MAG: hypothetical protein HRT90_03880, partial [Candidatus Margulisbacteria bacterium]|nr:hypothetical protein [Candidatus Margulisiibacteriota bacterium]
MILSLTNSKLTFIKRFISDSRFRKKQDTFVVETPKVIQEICAYQPENMVNLLVDENHVSAIDEKWKNVFTVKQGLLGQIVDVQSFQGMVAVVKRPQWDIGNVLDMFITAVILDGVSDPGNMGAIIRNAVAFNVGLLLFLFEMRRLKLMYE